MLLQFILSFNLTRLGKIYSKWRAHIFHTVITYCACITSVDVGLLQIKIYCGIANRRHADAAAQTDSNYSCRPDLSNIYNSTQQNASDKMYTYILYINSTEILSNYRISV
jgi:hypothetical protein